MLGAKFQWLPDECLVGWVDGLTDDSFPLTCRQETRYVEQLLDAKFKWLTDDCLRTPSSCASSGDALHGAAVGRQVLMAD